MQIYIDEIKKENPISKKPHKMRKSIAIDMDEVIAEMMTKMLGIYEEKYGRVLKKEEYWGKKLQDFPEIMALRPLIFEKGFFRDLAVMKDSQEVLLELSERFDLYIVTAAMTFRNSFEDKYDWLEEHFSFISRRNIVFCGDKHIIKTDWLIDDTPYNLKNFSGTPILYTSSHNTKENRYHRVNNWQEIREYFADK